MLYQRTQATASRSTSPIAPGAGVAGALPVADEFCFVQGVQRLGQGVNPFKQKTDTQTIKHARLGGYRAPMALHARATLPGPRSS